MMLRIAFLSAAVAFACLGTSAAQQPVVQTVAQPVLDPGVSLEGPGNATLNAISPIPNLVVGWESEKQWSVKYGETAPFYYARYRLTADTSTKRGGKARAGDELYGVYYNSGTGASKHDGKWVVKPEWSGLFPLTTDNMLVRAAGTETWYVIKTKNGSTSKLGTGRIGSVNIVDEETTGRVNLYGGELYYLITADDGAMQTIQLIEWNSRQQAFLLAAPIDRVVPADVLGESPVKLTMLKDKFVRRYDDKNEMYDFVVFRPYYADSKQPKHRSVLEVTHPHKQALYVLNAEKQLYFPTSEASDITDWSYQWTGDKDFLGIRPVGSGITTGLKDDPLEAFPDGLMAAVWNTPNGLRLAPLHGHWRSYTRSMDFWGIPYWDTKVSYLFNYVPAYRAMERKRWAVYTELYPVEIPQEVRFDPDSTLAWQRGVYAVYPNGTVDVYIVREGQANGMLTNLNSTALANMDAARAFVAETITPEGRKAFHVRYLKRVEDNTAKMAEAERLKQEREAAAKQAALKAEYAALEAKGEEVKRKLAARDYYGALNLAANGDTRYLPNAIVRTMNAGYGHIITLELAEAGLRWADDWQETHLLSRINQLRPPPPRRAAQYGSTVPSSGSSSSASGVDSNKAIMDAARARSQDNYNSGYTSSYLCGSASFCN